MMLEEPEEPIWDEANQRFLMPARCPYPDCDKPVLTSPATADAELRWCSRCSRPFEVVRVTPPEGGLPFELFRRPQTAFCTYTRHPLTGYSLLDWCEAGGGPGRSNSLDDSRGAIFGEPDKQTRIRIVPDKNWGNQGLSSMVAQTDPDDRVVSVSVVRGQTVAVTARGRISVFDAATGEPRHERPLDWPDGSTDPLDMGLAVRHPPAFRGTVMALAAPHQARFRDLGPLLLSGVAPQPDRKPVEPEAGTEFLGPPLGVDVGDRGFFCLLQGRAPEDGIRGAVLRFFDPVGDEIARHQVDDGIARPPVFSRDNGHVVWLDSQGIVSAIPTAELTGGKLGEPVTSLPSALLKLEPSDRPTLMAVRNTEARPGIELWVSSVAEGKTVLYRCPLDDLLRAPQETWYWEKRPVGKLGSLNGFAVGIGSRYHRWNASGQLLGVASASLAAQLERYSTSTATYPMPSGSHDPPIVCSAGVIARIQGYMCMSSRRIGWDDRDLHPRAPVPGIYDKPQGIAMFGRRVYIGHGLGVRAYRLVLENGA